jgi:predicted nucleic acid-binding protein
MASTHIACDTTVVAHLTKIGRHSAAYKSILGTRRISFSFQARSELLGAQYQGKRLAQLQTLLATTLPLPQTDATSIWYARIAAARKELKRKHQVGGDAGDADVWIIASAMEHRLALVSHDQQQVALARSMGHPTLTDLDDLRGANPTDY